MATPGTATFVQDGNAIDYTPTSDVAVGDVIVLGNLIAIARRDIPADTLGSLSTTGVFNFPKASGTSTAIAAWVQTYWDATNKVATTDDASGANKALGTSVLAAADADTTVRIRLEQ